MAKKPKVEGGEPAAALKHNPFAALALDRAALPVAEPTPAVAPPAPKAAKSRGRLVLRRETKHRGGKAVIIVRGLAGLADAEVESMAKQLKQKLGCGGTVERAEGEPELVLQGDQPAKVAEWLRAQGFRVDGVTR
jgi:translation initiation factor 1